MAIKRWKTVGKVLWKSLYSSIKLLTRFTGCRKLRESKIGQVDKPIRN
jgi:hypothetical protein